MAAVAKVRVVAVAAETLLKVAPLSMLTCHWTVGTGLPVADAVKLALDHALTVVAAGVVPIVAGKPHGPMAELIKATVGDTAAKQAVMVGDRPETDGLMAATLGCRYAHVESGVTAPGTAVSPTPDLVAANLAGVAKVLIDESAERGRLRR